MAQRKTFFDVLSTPQAVEAFLVGAFTLAATRNLDAGVKAMMVTAKENGSLVEAGTAGVQDLLRWIWDSLQGGR